MAITRRTLWACGASLLLAGGIIPVVTAGAPSASAATEPTFLFVNQNSNGPQGNIIQSYASYSTGTQANEVLLTSIPTGHPGSGSSFVAAPRADFTYDMTHTSGHLYALNLGDSTVSIFSMNISSGQLTLQATTPPLGIQSGVANGVTSVAVNPTGTVLYAGGAQNEQSPDELLAYHILSDGTVNPTRFRRPKWLSTDSQCHRTEPRWRSLSRQLPRHRRYQRG